MHTNCPFLSFRFTSWHGGATEEQEENILETGLC